MVRRATDAFADWAREAALPLASPDWRKTSPAELAQLGPLIDGKRIVLLGEPDHNISERVDYRVVLIRYLAEHGFRWVACEQGFSDGSRIDRYLDTGDESWIDRASDQGHRSPALVPGRDDDYDPHRGRWPDAWASLRRAEDRWFYRQLREMSATFESPDERMHYFGFDSDFVPGGGYEEISESLSGMPPGDAVFDSLRHAIARDAGESLEQEIVRLSAAAALAEASRGTYAALMGSWQAGRLVESIVALRDSLVLRREIEVQFSRETPDPVRWYQAMATREEAMARRMDWLIDSIGADQKIVVCAHNTHTAKDQRALWLGRNGESDIPPARTLGHHLAKRYGAAVSGIWLLFDQGEHLPHPMDRQRNLTVPSDPDRLEARLTEVGANFVLPTRSADPRSELLDERWNWWTGAATQSAIPRRGTDAVFFVERAHAPSGRD